MFTRDDIVIACWIWGILGLVSGVVITSLISMPKRDSRGRFKK